MADRKQPIEDIENPDAEVCDSWELSVYEDYETIRCCDTCDNYQDTLCVIWGIW